MPLPFSFLNKTRIFLLNRDSIWLVITFFLIWFVLIGSSLLTRDYVWDDLHFIRVFLVEDLLKSWKGNWDPDNPIMETPAYRPIALLIYHLLGFFDENVIYLRFFLNAALAFLILAIYFFIKNFTDQKNLLLIFFLILIFSKIFTTIIAWNILSAIFISYIFYFLSLNLLIKYIFIKSWTCFFWSLLFCFLAVFTREEHYAMVFIVPLIYLYFEKNFYKLFLISFPYFLIIISHYLLRSFFVPEAKMIKFSLIGLENIKNFSHSLIASFSPMSFHTPNLYDPFKSITFFIWITFLCFIIFLNKKNILHFKLKYYLFFFLLGFISASPNLITSRSFGILIPSVYFYIIISSLISDILIFNKKKFIKIFVFVGLSSSIAGGLHRSFSHLESIDQKSVYVIHGNLEFIYKFPGQGLNVTIPEKRLNRNIIYLKKLGIESYVSLEDLKKILQTQSIPIPKYHPLAF